MALDLNIPPTEDEEDDPFGGLPQLHISSNPTPPSIALDLNIPPTEDKGDPFGGLPQLHISSNPTPPSIALDLNIPPTEDKGDPFGGLPHGQEHPLLAGAHPIGDAYGAPSLDLNMQAYESG
jgi:hypothetical protein